MKEKVVYLECLSYMNNAKKALQKTKKSDGIYKNIKYVQMACEIAYNAVLMALDEYLIRQEPNKPKSKDIEDYKKRISRQNKFILEIFLSAYDELYIAGYYHGTPSVKTVQSGFEDAYKIIEFIK